MRAADRNTWLISRSFISRNVQFVNDYTLARVMSALVTLLVQGLTGGNRARRFSLTGRRRFHLQFGDGLLRSPPLPEMRPRLPARVQLREPPP